MQFVTPTKNRSDMENINHAVDEYLIKREQLGARKAAAHVIQTFGVTALDLSNVLNERGLLLVQQERRSRPRVVEVEPL